MPVVILIVVIIALVVIVNCVKIVPQAHAVVVERLGGYLTTWSVGLHFKVPFIDRIAKGFVEGTGGRFPTTAGNHKR